jgi:hypothetical protein
MGRLAPTEARRLVLFFRGTVDDCDVICGLHERRGKNPRTSESPRVMMDKQSYVTALYQVVLGRAPDRARTLECPIPELWRRHRRAGRLAQQR